MNFQHTLKRSASLTGIGLHSGQPATITLRPAPPNNGIGFVRSDLSDCPQILAHYKNIVNTQLATTLGQGKIIFSTVEHLMAALQGMGVDNAVVEVSGPEVPIMDGSSAPFVRVIQEAGLQSQLQVQPYVVLRRKVELKIAEKWAVAEPSNHLEIQASIDWDHPAIGYQEFNYVHGKSDFSEIAASRTWGMLRDVESLRSMGFAQGGSLDNAVVLDEGRVLNSEGLRYPDEFVRHKVLDALGDFKLAGVSIHAHFRLHRSGHDLHSQLLAAIFRDPENYGLIDPAAREDRPAARIRAALAGA